MTQIAGAVFGNLLYVGAGYFSCSVAFRLARVEQASWEEDDLAPGPRDVPTLTKAGKTVAMAGMALGIPLAFAAFWRGGLVLR